MSYYVYPAYAVIQDITQGVQTVITFTENHDFTPGEIVSFRIDKQNGMIELNNKQAVVVANDSTTITVNINSTFFTPFVFNEYVANLAVAVPSASGIIPNDPLNTVSLIDAFDVRSTT